VEANYPKLLANPKDKEDSIEFLVDGILIYGEQGKWSKVVSLSERMRDTAGSDGVIYNTAGRRFAFSYILAAYILENKSMAKEIFEDFCSTKMPSASWRFEEDTAAAVQDGEDLESENDGLSLSTSAFNNALDVLDAHGHLEEARETFGIMRELGVQFNVCTLAIFIQVYTILNPKTAKAAFEKMLQGGMIEKSSSNYKVEVDKVRVICAALNMYATQGEWQEVHDTATLFGELRLSSDEDLALKEMVEKGLADIVIAETHLNPIGASDCLQRCIARMDEYCGDDRTQSSDLLAVVLERSLSFGCHDETVAVLQGHE